MSLKKSATHRLSLLAGSSLVAAGLVAGSSLGVALAPTFAQAQTCSPLTAPAANPGADTYTCLAGTFPTGITYSSDGPLSVSLVANGATVNSTMTANGVNLTGNTTDTVTWNSAVGTVTGGAGTAGPVIDVTSVSGAISITTAGITGTQAGTTHAIRATSTGGAAITITRSAGTVSNTVVGGQAAIEAVTNGGAISITTVGTTQGRARGILAQTSGAAAVTISTGGNVSAAVDDNNPVTVDGLAAIDTIVGTGATAITINSGSVNGGAGAAIRSVSASTSAATAVNVQNTGGTISGRVDFSGVSAGGVTLNNTGASATTGRWLAAGASVFGARNDTLTMGGLGVSTMASGSSIDFGAGADTFNMSGQLEATGASIDFGAGTDAFNLSGALSMNGLTLSNLEALNNSGVIYMGGTGGAATDLRADDVMVMTSGTFTGSGSGRVVMDVIPGAATQAGCATITVGDCLDLRGASTAGVTLLTLNDVTDGGAPQGAFNALVTLVDVGGAGTSAAGHFVIDPDTEGYTDDPVYGGTIGRPGLFVYALQYDAATQRHNLVGLPRSETMEYVILGGAAQSIWHLTSQAVTDRQSVSRTSSDGGGVWLRATGDYTKRNLATSLDSFGDTFTFDNSYRLYSGALIGGMDLITGSSGGHDYALGVQAGYVGSSFDLDQSASTGRFTGATGGVYGSIWNGRYFLDTTLNSNFLTLDYDQPGSGARTNTYLYSFGAQAEGGFRGMLSEHAYVEPLATLAFVRTTFEEISLTGGEVEPEDTDSLRASLGLRFGADVRGGPVNVSYVFTGRVWDEFEGASGGLIHNPGQDLTFADTFDGVFGEAQAGLNLYDNAGVFSGFVTTGVKFKDGYEAVNLSAGLRMAW